MTEMTDALLFLPRLRVLNANAISSPVTWGFPAPSAFTGFVHALGLRAARDFDLQFEGAGIICHQFEPQVFRPPGRRTQVFRLTRNPVDKDGKTAAIVEEGRVHLGITLIVGLRGESLWDGSDPQGIATRLHELAGGMRLAGGSILPDPRARRKQPVLVKWAEDSASSREQSAKLRRLLLPGFALVERQDLLEAHRQDMGGDTAGVSPLDALMDLSRLNFEPDEAKSDQAAESTWNLRRRPGWLVPVPLGYAAISPLYGPGEVANARDANIPFRFVESVLGLGQWISPHRVDDLRRLLWYHRAEPQVGLYRCRNDFASTAA